MHSQPLPESPSLHGGLRGDEDIATKKRKLTRTYSERRTETDDPYAIPSSPPRPPSSKRRSPAKDTDDSKTKKLARVPKPVIRLTRSETPPQDDIVMKDVAEQSSMPFSAKTSRSLKNLSVNSSISAKSKQDMPLRLSHGRSAASQPVSKNPLPTPTSSAQEPTTNPRPRRKRLIDTLAEQAESEPSDDCEDEDKDGDEPQESLPKLVPRPRPDIEITFRDLTPEPVAMSSQSMRVRRVALDKGPRFTYSQQRTMLAEEDDFLGSGLGAISDVVGGSMFNFGGLPKLSAPSKFSFLDEDDETVNTGAVRSLHELRQAGANHRFADEMHDFLDRIGTPSSRTTSLRRGALLELAQKMSDQNFRRQFRNHGDDRNLFQSLGEETDVISGFSLLAIVVTLLAASSSAHLLPKLRAQGLAVLIGRLLREAADIVVLAKDRSHNATKNAQRTLATIKESVLALPIWEPASAKTLGPRTLSMKCLDLMTMQPFDMDNDDEILTPGAIDQLWSVLSANMSNEACWEFPSQPESTDFYMALYLLEPQIINAMIAGHREIWTEQYVPIAVALLDTALRRPLGRFNTVENRVVRFLVNFTNDNGEACRMFYDQGLLQALAKCTCGMFDMIIKSMRENVFPDMMHETLTLMLAGMINLCVHYSPAARNFQDREGAADLLDHLIKVFAEHHSQTENVRTPALALPKGS